MQTKQQKCYPHRYSQVQTEGDILRIEIKRSKFTQEDFAARMGFSRNYLLRLMERAVLPDDIKEKASQILKVKIEGLQLHTKGKQNLVEEGTPIYELSATATQTEYSSQLPEVPAFRVTIPGYEDCNFGMHVYGHSMYPTIETGSLVLCRKVLDKSVIMYGEILKLCKLDRKKYSLYGWKHTGNVDSFLAGVDIYDLMRQNRHHSIAQTEQYLQSMGLRPNINYSNKAPKL